MNDPFLIFFFCLKDSFRVKNTNVASVSFHVFYLILDESGCREVRPPFEAGYIFSESVQRYKVRLDSTKRYRTHFFVKLWSFLLYFQRKFTLNPQTEDFDQILCLFAKWILEFRWVECMRIQAFSWWVKWIRNADNSGNPLLLFLMKSIVTLHISL